MLDKLGFRKLHEVGITGKGVKVVVADTGVYSSHPMLYGKVKGEVSFVPDEPVTDLCGHGTSVASIIACLAPDADIYSVKVLDKDGHGDLGWILHAYDYSISIGADVMNMSLGSPINCCVSSIAMAHYRAVSYGVIPVYAVGNYGAGRVSCPAMVWGSVSVGSSNLDGDPASFSSCGAGCLGDPKPLCMEYGGGDDYCILTAWSPESVLFRSETVCIRGTSQATPIFSSIVALTVQMMRDKEGVKPNNNDIVSWAYQSTGTRVRCGGAGVVDAYRYVITAKSVGVGTWFLARFLEGLRSLITNKDVLKSILMFTPAPWYIKAIIYSHIVGGGGGHS